MLEKAIELVVVKGWKNYKSLITILMDRLASKLERAGALNCSSLSGTGANCTSLESDRQEGSAGLLDFAINILRKTTRILSDSLPLNQKSDTLSNKDIRACVISFVKSAAGFVRKEDFNNKNLFGLLRELDESPAARLRKFQTPFELHVLFIEKYYWLVFIDNMPRKFSEKLSFYEKMHRSGYGFFISPMDLTRYLSEINSWKHNCYGETGEINSALIAIAANELSDFFEFLKSDSFSTEQIEFICTYLRLNSSYMQQDMEEVFMSMFNRKDNSAVIHIFLKCMTYLIMNVVSPACGKLGSIEGNIFTDKYNLDNNGKLDMNSSYKNLFANEKFITKIFIPLRNVIVDNIVAVLPKKDILSQYIRKEAGELFILIRFLDHKINCLLLRSDEGMPDVLLSKSKAEDYSASPARKQTKEEHVYNSNPALSLSSDKSAYRAGKLTDNQQYRADNQQYRAEKLASHEDSPQYRADSPPCSNSSEKIPDQARGALNRPSLDQVTVNYVKTEMLIESECLKQFKTLWRYGCELCVIEDMPDSLNQFRLLILKNYFYSFKLKDILYEDRAFILSTSRRLGSDASASDSDGDCASDSDMAFQPTKRISEEFFLRNKLLGFVEYSINTCANPRGILRELYSHDSVVMKMVKMGYLSIMIKNGKMIDQCSEEPESLDEIISNFNKRPVNAESVRIAAEALINFYIKHDRPLESLTMEEFDKAYKIWGLVPF